jgi:hypothetical protein
MMRAAQGRNLLDLKKIVAQHESSATLSTA